MEDFEFSVEISDRDWEGFFAECEECNMLPPALAGLDSGMSDFDETGPRFAKRGHGVDLTADIPGADCPIDTPPNRESSPVERYLGKHGAGGLESVLSGSEEDIHLQSVNIFFEGLKSLSETERPPELCQVRGGNTQAAATEQEQCSDGQPSRSGALPENIPEFNYASARGETAVGRELTSSVVAISNVNTIKPAEVGSDVSPDAAAGNSVLRSNTPTDPETDLFAREEGSAQCRVCGTTQSSQIHEFVGSDAQHTDTTMDACVCTTPKDEPFSPITLSEKCIICSNGKVEMTSNVKHRDEQAHVLHLDTMSVNKSQSHESSSSASIKRKRRKKRRLGCEPAEATHGYERRPLERPSDSEEEPFTGRGRAALCLSEDSFNFSAAQKNMASVLCSNYFPVRTLPKETKTNSPTAVSSENILQQQKYKEIHSPTSGNVILTTTSSSKMQTQSQLCKKLQSEELNDLSLLPVSASDDVNKNICTAEVKPTTHNVSHDPTMGLGQNDNQSYAKSVLAADAGNSVGDQSTQCHRQTEPQQQLETRHRGISSSHVTSPDTSLGVSETDTCLDTAWQTERPLEVQVLSRLAQLAASHLKAQGNPSTSVEDVHVSTSDNFRTTPSESGTTLSDITSVSSLLTESVSSLSNENFTPLSGSFCSSVGYNESGGRGETYPLITSQSDSTESKCGSLVREDAVTERSETSECTVFAMSSFWRDMEKLTINDILGVRMSSKASPLRLLPSLRPLPPLPEMQEMVVTDSGFFTQSDEPKLIESSEHMPSIVDSPVREDLTSEAADASSCSSVLWESEPVTMSLSTDLCSVDIAPTSVKDISQPVLSGNVQQGLRKISKSVHHLPDLAPGNPSSSWKQQQIQDLDQVESKCGIRHSQAADEETFPTALNDSYRISVSDIFHYLFGRKESIPSQSAPDSTTTTRSTAGNSVPEMYDHFFSEFDNESLFCPLITDEDRSKDEQVPIFSCSRSACRNFQFPEVYDCFFPSSSSDESSVESDEEDTLAPMRVVNRFTRKASSSQMSTDIYDNFFTDSDLSQNLFWNATLSFRNMNFSAFMVQKETLSRCQTSPVPLRQSGRTTGRTVYTSTLMGNQMMFPDPLLFHLEERISRQQVMQTIRLDDLQAAVSNPRLDSSFLALQQSDMCLVCIAFASWVLKTANPQVGDTWKAVLLANISALSAIRYLRKYVRMEAAGCEKELQHTPSSECRSVCL